MALHKTLATGLQTPSRFVIKSAAIIDIWTTLFHNDLLTKSLCSSPLAEVVKLVDTHVSGTCEETRGGSSPLLGTTKNTFQLQSYLKK